MQPPLEITLPLPNRKACVRKIIQAEAEVAGVAVEELLSRTRRAPVVRARRLAMYRARQETGLGYNTLGELFNKHHTSVITAVGRFLGLRRGSMQGKINDLEPYVGDPDGHDRDYPADAYGEIHAEAAPAPQEIPL